MSEFLDQMRLEMDPVADKIVERIVSENGAEEARKLFSVLIRNVDIPFDKVPSYVQDYMRENASLPAHFDLERIRRGQEVFVDEGLYFCGFLYFKSLPTCYLDWKGVQVLYQTGRLDASRGYPEIFARRIAETLQFLLDCMEPGSLEPGGKARQTILKIRLIHASIRHFIQQRPEWDSMLWDKPINQEDMALTLQSFGTTMLMGMEQLKKPLSAEREGDYHYAWQAVGHILGLREELNPKTVAEGKALMKKILDRNEGTSEAGRSLTQALIDFGRELVPLKGVNASIAAMVRFYLGERHAAMLGVEAKGCLTKFLPEIISRSINWTNKLEDSSEKMEDLMNKFGLKMIEVLQKRMNSVKGVQLRVPERMKEAWGA